MHFHHEPPDNSRSNERGVLRTELIIGQLRRKVRGIDFEKRWILRRYRKGRKGYLGQFMKEDKYGSERKIKVSKSILSVAISRVYLSENYRLLCYLKFDVLNGNTLLTTEGGFS